MEKKWYQSKTVWFNVVMTVLDLLAALSSSPLLADRPDVLAVLTTIHGAGNVLLRFITDAPIEKSVL
jgi:hypothetical protein